MTTDERAWRKLNMSWGVTPVLSEEYSSIEVLFYRALGEAKRVKALAKGDNVVLTGGQINGRPGNTNMIRLETVK
jgi:pyruvate kinase